MLPDNTWGPATVLVVVLVIIGAIAGAVAVFTTGFMVTDFLDWIWKAILGVAGLGGARAAFAAAKK